MFRCYSKDVLDKFFVQAVDEQYEINRLTGKKYSNSFPSRKTFTRRSLECSDFSTSSSDEEIVNNRINSGTSISSFFNQNIFESRETLKIKNALTNGWREKIENEKMLMIMKFLKTKNGNQARHPQRKLRNNTKDTLIFDY
jgi:hypothetical protein